MPSRVDACRCCSECNDCDVKPSLLVAHVEYPVGKGVIIKADSEGQWSDVSTSCAVSGVGVVTIRVTEPGNGYTSPPTVTLSGGGGTVTTPPKATIRSPIHTITVDDKGSGYSASPAVTVSVPANGGRIRPAYAYALVEGEVVSVTLTKQGEGYVSPPLVTVVGGKGAQVTPVMSGYVSSIILTAAGEEYTSAPTVTLSGGGGSKATAFATLADDKTVATITVLASGSGYTEPPTVKISGGGGFGAKATANLLYRVSGLTLEAGGEGYPPSPQILIEPTSGGGGGAEATAKISGSVVKVEVLDGGLYQNRKTSMAGPAIDWPTVSIAGNAKVSPTFNGTVHSVSPPSSTPYTSPPSVSFSGGGGTGAEAVAELNWETSHERTAEMLFCLAQINSDGCVATTATNYPPPVPSPGNLCPQPHTENLAWRALGTSSNDEREITALIRGSVPALLPAPSRAWMFQGEAILGVVYKSWAVQDVIREGDAYLWQSPFEAFVETHKSRFFSRVPPDVVYRLRASKAASTVHCELTPTFRQYVDQKGDSFWYLESVEITNPGENLYYPIVGAFAEDAAFEPYFDADGNSRHFWATPRANVTVARGEPELSLPHLEDFSVQPSVVITLNEAGGFYFVASVSLEAGGVTNLGDGPITIELRLDQGHYRDTADARNRITATIANGTIASVSVASTGLILPPASLVSVQLPEDPSMATLFGRYARVVVGESSFTTETTHTEPTVSASCEPTDQEDGVPAELSVSLQEDTDENGRSVWRVSAVEVGDQGSGYAANVPVLFEADEPGIESFPAVAQAVLDRNRPTLNASGSLPGFGADLLVNLSEQETDDGDLYWEVESVSVIAPGVGYLPDSTVSIGGATFSEAAAFCRASVNGTGGIVAVEVLEKGRYYDQADRIRRVMVRSPGEYFVREISETDDPLPDVSCIGEMTAENGWDVSKRRMIVETGREVAVSESFTTQVITPSDSKPVNRVRRCGIPDITLEFR